MKINNFLFSFLILALQTSLIGQYENLEVLDHTDHNTILSSFVYNKGDILYVVNNNRRGYASTQIKLIEEGEAPRNLLENELTYESDSDYFYDSDGRLTLFIYGLANAGFDDFSPDYIEVKEEDDGSYSVNRIRNPFFISLEGIISMALDSLDNVYTLTNYPRLQIFKEDTLIEETFRYVDQNSLLHHTLDGDVFLLDSGQDSIHRINNLDFDFINTLNIDIKETKNINNEIWVLDASNQIFIYEDKFISEPRPLDLPFIIQSLDQVSVFNSIVHILESNNNGYILYTFLNEDLRIIKEVQEEFAASDKLHMINDTAFLTTGQYEIRDIANHAFLRSYKTNQDFNPQRTDINLEYFNFTYSKDTILSGAPTDLWIYDINYTYSNFGDTDIATTSVYTSDLQPTFTSGYFLYQGHHNNPVAPNESTVIDTTKFVAYDHPSNAKAVISGSDYKFNLSGNPIDINITTSTYNLKSFKTVSVFPNPFSNQISYEADFQIRKIELFDAMGKHIKYDKDIGSGKINVNNVPAGLYHLNLIGDKERSTHKILKVTN